MNQYRGIDILEVQGDGSVPRSDAFGRGFVLLGPPTGKIEMDDPQQVSAAVRDYQWTGIGMADVAALKEFIDSRRARARAFWLDTFEEDLDLGTGTFPAAATNIEIEAIGYAANMFPGTGARRHIAIRNRASGVSIRRKVTASENLLNGRESLSLDAALGQDVTKAGWSVSFLRLCRLQDDITAMTFIERNYATATIRAVEVPKEAAL